MRTAQLLLLSSFLTSAAWAQSFEVISHLRMNDTTPRTTRAIALGGATDPLGDADMAANPATLATVKRPMFFVQGARNSLAVVMDYTASRTRYPESYEATSLSQIAAAAPVGPVVVGVYYASEPRIESFWLRANAFGSTPYVAPPPCIGDFRLSVFRDTSPFQRAEQRTGIALAWERGPFTLGGGAELQHVAERLEVPRMFVNPPPAASQFDRFFHRVDGRALVPNAGVRWRVTSRIALAAAYNGAASFTRTTSLCNQAEPVVYTVDLTCTSAVTQITSSTERLPDAWRASASFAATERLRLVAEGVRRRYSKLADDPYTTLGRAERAPYNDVTELHAGAEYKLRSVALRAGWWRDPSRFDLVPNYGETVTHYTFGAGIGVGSARLDLAYDHASLPGQRRAVVGLAFGL